MARLAEFVISPKVKFSCELVKLEREKIYGYAKLDYFDKSGDELTKANLLDDGKTILGSGSSSMVLMDDKGEIWKRSELVGYLPDGKNKDIVPSVFDGAVKLKKAESEDLLNIRLKSVYLLKFESEEEEDKLKQSIGDEVYHFEFNYRADYEGDSAFILRNSDGIFLLTGQEYEFRYLEKSTSMDWDDDNDEEGDSEELDFSMF